MTHEELVANRESARPARVRRDVLAKDVGVAVAGAGERGHVEREEELEVGVELLSGGEAVGLR